VFKDIIITRMKPSRVMRSGGEARMRHARADSVLEGVVIDVFSVGDGPRGVNYG
jgi:hypothetical protein